MNDNLKQMLAFLALSAVSVIAVTVIFTVTENSEHHNDFVTLDKDEQNAWNDLVSNYHLQ